MDRLVFVVDDDDSMRTAIARLLRSVGLSPRTFASAEEFLAAERPAVPSCLVLDVRMPNMSGIELQKVLAGIASDLPIIFVTAHADVRMAVDAMKTGALEFLPKPFEDQDLLKAVQLALARHQHALEDRRSAQDAISRLDTLSRRENEVLRHVIAGRLNKQIGYALGITEKTVKAHRAKVMEKMGAQSVPDLVRIAQRAGIAPTQGHEDRPG